MGVRLRLETATMAEPETNLSMSSLIPVCYIAPKEPRGRNKSTTIDFWKSRYQKTQGPISRFYRQDEFQILGGCLYNRTGAWRFRFIRTAVLPRHPKDKKRLWNRVSLERDTSYGAGWHEDLTTVLKELAKDGF